MRGRPVRATAVAAHVAAEEEVGEASEVELDAVAAVAVAVADAMAEDRGPRLTPRPKSRSPELTPRTR